LELKSRSKTSLQFLQHPISWAIPPVGGAIDLSPVLDILNFFFSADKNYSNDEKQRKRRKAGKNCLGKRRCRYSKSFGGGPGPASEQPPQPTPNPMTMRPAVSPPRQ
jgi:hypothetical protein